MVRINLGIMNIALIRNNTVENIIVADLEFANQLGYDEVIDTEVTAIGMGWTKINDVWTSPETIETPPVTQLQELTFLQFMMGRLTDDEILDIYKKEKATDTDEGMMVHIGLDFLRQAQGIVINDPGTIRIVGIWEALNLVTPERAIEILTP